MKSYSTSSSISSLLAVNFVGTLGFSIVIPFLAILVTRWGGNAVVYGVLAATYSFFQLFGAPILGRWSDRIGRRKVLLISQFGTLVSWGIFAAAFAFPVTALATVRDGFLGEFAITLPLILLFAARAADGLTGGNVSVSNAYLADVTPEKDRSRNFGRMAISGNLGFIFGPMIAGLLGATMLAELLPVLAAVLISAIALLLILFTLKDVDPGTIIQVLGDASACDVFGQEQKPGYQIACKQPDGLRVMLSLPHLPGLLAINFLVMLGFSFFYVAFPIYAVQDLGWTLAEMGAFFAVLSLFMVVIQGPVLSWAASRVSEKALIAGGSLILGLGFVLLVSADTKIIYLAALLIAIGNGLMWPTFMAALSNAAGKQLQGAVQGFAGSAGAIASILGLVGGGIAFVQVGASIFFIAAGITAITAVISVVQSSRSMPPEVVG